jgi:NDP-sugar pyrophosphorylase family protein
VDEHATVRGSIAWANTLIGADAVVEDALLGRNCQVGRSVRVGPGSILGDRTVATDYSQF